MQLSHHVVRSIDRMSYRVGSRAHPTTASVGWALVPTQSHRMIIGKARDHEKSASSKALFHIHSRYPINGDTDYPDSDPGGSRLHRHRGRGHGGC